MPARSAELAMLIASTVAIAAAMLVIPRLERREERARKDDWAIIDREFIDFQEDRNV